MSKKEAIKKKVVSEDSNSIDYEAVLKFSKEQIDYLGAENKRLEQELEWLEEWRDTRAENDEKLRDLLFQRRIEVIGVSAMNQLVSVLVGNGYQVVVSSDSYQRTKHEDERAYSIEYINPDYEGLTFTATEH